MVCVQLVSYVVLVCAVCSELIKPPPPPDDGRKKKRRRAVVPAPPTVIVRTVCVCVAGGCVCGWGLLDNAN